MSVSNLTVVRTRLAIVGGLCAATLAAPTQADNRYFWTRIGITVDQISAAPPEGAPVVGLYGPGNDPEDIELDPETGTLYWICSSTGRLQSGASAGGELPEIIADGLGFTTALKLDTTNGWIYYSDWISDSIRRIDFSGTTIETVVTGVEAMKIFLDIENERMFWTNRAGLIQQSNLDGSSILTLASGDEAWSPEGIVVDTITGYVYWVTSGFNAGLWRIPVGGGEWDSLVLFAPFSRAVDLEIDLDNGHLYWTEAADDVIRRSELSGSDIVEVASGLVNSPVGLAIDYSVTSSTEPIPGDLNEDGVVDTLDFLALLAAWGPCGVECPADLDNDGVVGVLDFLELLANWG